MLWGIRPVEQQAAHGLAVERLRNRIHLGLLEPLERLPAERSLAEIMAVARVTLREAIRILETEGYVWVKRGATGGAIVKDEDCLRVLALRRIARDPAAAMRVVEFLGVNERVAAGFAAERRTPAQLKQMRDAAAAVDSARSFGALRRAESTFRLALVEASQNPLLTKAVEDASGSAFLPLADGVLGEAAAAAHAERLAVLRAVDARNKTDAEAAVTAILDREWRRFRNPIRLAHRRSA